MRQPFRMPFRRADARGLSANTLTALAAAALATLYSLSFWDRLLAADIPDGGRGWLFLVAAWLVVFALNGVFLSLLAWRGLQKPALAVVLVVSAATAYFMDGFGAVVDRHAVQSVLETDLREGSEWFSWQMAAYLVGLGLLPAAGLLMLPVRYRAWPRELLARAGYMLAMLLLVGAAVAPFSREMASTARNHGELRHLAAPLNLANALRAYVKHSGPRFPDKVEPLGTDARGGGSYISAPRPPLLLVLVVGESAREQSFSLGGYARQTNPRMAAERINYFGNVSSCGTNTATSLPCMFSDLGRENYDESRFKGRENLLDVLARAGFKVDWKDNNTGSKGIARRLGEVRMSEVSTSPHCQDGECHDEVFVEDLRRELATPGGGDRVLVLHMLGSHGPAYFKRYPPAFAKFTPACESVALQDCTPEQIRNSYDNTILYTDHVLGELLGVLQAQGDARIPALLYLSDHGESTGEGGLYLHGAPYLVAPREQTRVPMLLWTSEAFERWRRLDPACVATRRDEALSHDHFFHTVLGLLDVQTTAYRPELDALAGCAPG
ncbi:phosphoethanolamine--lipid A transferase [bacterium BD-1]|uniref:phosphoethanolamine transferase n=1 Tax=Arenimonas sp. TaxID=1872635 RepID=UPI001E4FA8AB|nr:phosphoethanolamine--lipid A transferase [Ottowia caeni]